MTETAAEYRKMFDRVTFAGSVILISILLGLLIWGIYYIRQYEGIVTVDAFNQGQVARQFYLGEGMTTQVIKPISLLLGSPVERIPDAYISPLPVIVLAQFFNLAGVNDGALLAYSLFWALLTGVALFIFARVLFKDLIVAALAFLLYMSNIALIESGFSGQSFPLVSFFLLLYIWLYYKRNRSSLPFSALLGGLAGLLYLSEFDYFLLVIPLAVFLFYDSPSRRGNHVLLFLAGLFLVSLPWLVRNAVVFGNPFFSLRWFDFKSYSLLFPGNRISRDFSSLAFSSAFPISVFWNKFLMFVRLMHPLWLSFSLSLLTPFFLGGLFLGFRDRAWSRAARLSVTLFFAQLVLVAAGNGDLTRMLYFVPLLVIGGLAVLGELLERSLHWGRKWFSALVAGFCLASAFPGLVSLAYGLPLPRYLPAVFTPEEAAQIRDDGPLERLQ
ncbi:MAG: hypothetical protein P9M08_02510, partial [Candidatus Erginobacter occultus]|nr:hypothetical protein [Candidatus Erginobacter occultus]